MTFPAKTEAEKITRSGKPGAIKRAWLAWLAYRSSCVFAEELHGWPKVRHAAPGVFIIKAPHIGPRRVQNFSGWKPPVGTGLAFGALYWFGYRHIATPQALLQNSITVGVIFAIASILPWRWLAWKTRLVIRFNQGVMTWRGPDLKKHVVGPEEPREMQSIPHRWGPEEARKQADWMRRNPGRTAEPLFQTASELVMNTGQGGMVWRTIAEFCNDENREQAYRLQAALELVTAAVAEELAARAREAAA